MYYNLKMCFFLSRSIQFRLIFTVKRHQIGSRWIFVMTPKLLWGKPFTLQGCRSLQIKFVTHYKIQFIDQWSASQSGPNDDWSANVAVSCVDCVLCFDHHEPMSMLVQVQRQKMDTDIKLIHTKRLLRTGGVHIYKLTGICCSKYGSVLTKKSLTWVSLSINIRKHGSVFKKFPPSNFEKFALYIMLKVLKTVYKFRVPIKNLSQRYHIYWRHI